MIRTSLLLAVSAMALATAATAQDGGRPVSLTGTVGIISLNLPNAGTGVMASGTGTFDTTDTADQVGIVVGGSMGIGLGPWNGFDAAFGLAGFLAVGSGSSANSVNFTGPGVVTIGGFGAPNSGSATVTTSSAPGNSTGSATASNTNPQGGASAQAPAGAINPGPGSNNTVAVTPNGESFLWGGVVLQQGPGIASAAGYAAIVDTAGGVFIGAGDLTGLSITTNTSHQTIYAGADMTLALSRPVGDGPVIIQGYAGPSVRTLSQRSSSSTTIDVPEAPGTGTTFPLLTLETGATLMSHYLGSIAGLVGTTVVAEKVALSLGVEGGLYYRSSVLSGTESWTVAGGGPVPYPSQTVTTAPGASGASQGFAYAVRANAVGTYAISPTSALSLGAGVDYLSSVPTLNNAGPALATNTYVAGSDDGTATYAPGAPALGMTFGSMLAVTLTASITGQF